MVVDRSVIVPHNNELNDMIHDHLEPIRQRCKVLVGGVDTGGDKILEKYGFNRLGKLQNAL